MLSNGIKPLAEIVKGGGTERMGSEEVRLSDLPCVISEDSGVFSEFPRGIHSLESGIRLIEDACKKFYGTPLRSFLERLVADQEKTKATVRDLMKRFMRTALVTESDAWEQRFAKKFTLAFAAGVLASRWKILPWSEQKIEAAVLDCYTRARKAISTADELERVGLRRLDAILRNETKVVRLHKLSKAQKSSFKPKLGQAFLDKNDKHGCHLIVAPKRFEKWMRSANVAQLVLQALDRDRRLIRTEHRVPTCQRVFPWEKKRRRYYIIALKSIGSGMTE